jgi:prevent-host-death family protein
MSEIGRALPRVGVRELRQNLSVYLRRVEAGETLEVTEHGRPVAVLAPRRPDRASIVERLVAEGRAAPATGDLLELGPPPTAPAGGPSATEVLLRMRDEERG